MVGICFRIHAIAGMNAQMKSPLKPECFRRCDLAGREGSGIV